LRIDVEAAREYFAHPSQEYKGITADKLPGEPFQYWADGDVCGVFHPSYWPGVWAGHIAVKPEAWGHTEAPARRIIQAFLREQRPERLVGWIDKRNRLMVRLALRIGFQRDGEIPLPSGNIIMVGM
jgi:RimJ/RimL family protein N-acetyltransferase